MAHRLAPEAETDLHSTWHYVATESNSDIADRLIDAITSRILLVARYPHLGRRRDADLRPGLRTFVAKALVLVYRVLDDGDVLVLRVLRGSRDLEALLAD
jgi:toxin ParE1/3/4